MVADTRDDRFDTWRAELGAFRRPESDQQAQAVPTAGPHPPTPLSNQNKLSRLSFCLSMEEVLSLTLNGKQVNALLFCPK